MSRRTYHFMLLSLLMLFIVLGFPMISGSGDRLANWRGTELHPTDDVERVAETVIRTIRVTVSVDEDEFALLQQWNQEFTRRYPHIHVVADNLPYAEAYAALKSSAMLGEAPDIMLLDSSWVTDFAAFGYLKNVDSLFAGELFSDVPAGLVQPLKWNGYLWGVPKDADPLVTVWSGLLLQRLGMGEPPQSWQELLSLAALADADSQLSPLPYLAGFEAEQLPAFLAWLTAVGGTGDPYALPSLLKQPQAAERFAELDKLRIQGRLWAASDSRQLAEALEQGQLWSAALPISHVFGKLQTEARRLIVKPQLDDVPLWSGGRSFSLSSRTEYAEEAKLWIEFITDPLRQQLLFSQTGKLPARRSALAKLGTGSLPEALLDELEAASGTRRDAYWNRRFDLDSRLWRRWLTGELPVQALFTEGA